MLAPSFFHSKALDSPHPSLDALYQDLHRNPELSLQEEKTSMKMAAQLRKLGFEVTERVGGYGVVGALKHGAGPTVMVRTDMDALPIKEQTKLPYANTVTVKGDSGEVGRSCTPATTTPHDRLGWRSRLAGELEGELARHAGVRRPACRRILQDAKAMLADGLMKRFPKPDFVLGLHDFNLLPAGQIGIVSGPDSAASNSGDITFYGKGGHGAAPHLTKDPVLIAARSVVTFQSIVSREVSPFDAAIVTVGTFHAGSKRDIIADEAKLELTVRSYKTDVQKHLLEAMHVDPKVTSDVLVNDPALAVRLSISLKQAFGDANVLPISPSPASEDFGEFGCAAGVPSIQLRVGMVEPGEYAAAKAAGKSTPGSHTANFAPDRERTIRAGTQALAVAVMDLLRPGAR